MCVGAEALTRASDLEHGAELGQLARMPSSLRMRASSALRAVLAVEDGFDGLDAKIPPAP